MECGNMEHGQLDFFWFVFILLTGIASSVLGWTAEGEFNIRRKIFDPGYYHRLVRPNQTTEVLMSLNLMTINHLSIEDQMLSVTGWLTIEWQDSRLKWTPNSTFDSDHVFSTYSEIWTPDLFIDNSLVDVSMLYDRNLVIRVDSNGNVDLKFPRIFHTACEIDTTYFPFDTQHCAVEVTSWTYTMNELNLINFKDEINVEELLPSGEWTFLGSEIKRSVITETDRNGEEVYSELEFVMILERKYIFYITHIVLPVLLTSFLNVFVFLIPASSGEKISYSLTVLLALAVLLTLVAESMPNTSLHISILSLYLAFTLCMGVLCVFFSVIIIRKTFIVTLPPKKKEKHVSDDIICDRLSDSILRYFKDRGYMSEDGKRQSAHVQLECQDGGDSSKISAQKLDFVFFVITFTLTSVATIVFITSLTILSKD